MVGDPWVAVSEVPLSKTVSLSSTDPVDEARLVTLVETLFSWGVDAVLSSEGCGLPEAG